MNRPDYITDQRIAGIIESGLQEDVGTGDVTSLATVGPRVSAEGRFLCKQSGVVAGLAVAAEVFRVVDDGVTVAWRVGDGGSVHAGDLLGTVSGPARGILAAERLALNVLQRMSGIATMTRAMVDAAAPHGARILDTRKTAPGLRLLDKWAVLLGGGFNHRIGLFDMILIKENHIACSGGLEEAVSSARRFAETHDPPLQIELEVTTLDEVRRALKIGGIDRLLLDNMTSIGTDGRLDTATLRAAVDLIAGRIETEASGNVTPDTVAEIARTGVNNISSGALTHSVAALDISLLLEFTDLPEGRSDWRDPLS